MDRIETRRSGRALTRREALRLIALGGAGVVLAACGGASGPTGARTAPTGGGAAATDYSARFAGFQAAPEPNADLARVAWPDFVTEAGPEVRALYEFQLTHGEIMRYMPCFCGCHLEDGHASNRDCYVESVGPDGTAVLDSMAPT